MKLIVFLVTLFSIVLARDYIFVNIPKTWVEADKYCQSTYNTRLATITNPQEDAIAGARCRGQCFFGANDRKYERRWVNIDGSPMTFKDWNPGEPNDFGPGEDCAVITGNNKMNDFHCSVQQFFLCDKPGTINAPVNNAINPRPTSRPTDRPSTRRPTDRPSTRPTSRPTDRPEGNSVKPVIPNVPRPTSRPTSRPTDRPYARPYVRPTSRPTDRPYSPISRPTSRPTDRPTDRPTNRPTYRPTDRPGGNVVKPVAPGVPRPTSRPTSRPTDRPTSRPTDRPASNGDYIYVRGPKTFYEAKKFCESIGSSLADIKSRTDDIRASSKCRGSGFPYNQCLIGTNDRNREGRFSNIDGSPATFFDWNPGEPNNVGNEDCVELLPNGKMNDIPCSGGSKARRAFLCNPKPLSAYQFDNFFENDNNNGYNNNNYVPLNGKTIEVYFMGILTAVILMLIGIIMFVIIKKVVSWDNGIPYKKVNNMFTSDEETSDANN